ncbi:hypothetical protein AY601_3538 [Pedobacter cryoconitis]|uniref:Peptidase C39 domain-containing protein n=1 Tax=Pedobacter cryoconitis TaxID=188932 RepID=A0A127VG99_9SPHI|nr:cysteine peptidase family C39 domain-containing protein [Pedobacter cryoconitis]AMQ00403.1 hypothetical protein AY601_3538 [Pedobacter cryoconitis]
MYKNATPLPYPFYKQQQDNECALSCLKMVSEFYGKQITFEYLRELVQMDPEGISIYNVVKSLNLLNFKSLVVSATYFSLLEKAILPCIMLWKSNHYVVIYNITDGYVNFADPNTGLLMMDIKDFSGLYKDSEKEEWIILLEPRS